MQSVWPNHKIFQRHDSEQCLVMFYRQNFSRLYTLRIFFKVFGSGTNLSPQTSRVQLWQICDRPSFAFPYIQCSSHHRFTLRARNKIFFFSPSLWLWVSSAKWIFHLTLQKWWLGMGRRGGGVFPALPLMSEYSLSGTASTLLAAIKQTVSPRTRGDYACVCPLCSQTSSSIWQ